MKTAVALDPPGTVVARLDLSSRFRRVPGTLGDRVLSTLLEEAIAGCLSREGHDGVTVEFNVRHRHPVLDTRPATVRARIEKRSPPLFRVIAELIQAEVVRAVATATICARD